MPLVHAAILPDIASSTVQHESAQEAMRELEGELYFMQPETIVIISETNELFPGTFLHAGEYIASPVQDPSTTPHRIDTETTMHIKSAIDRTTIDHTQITLLPPLSAELYALLERLCAHMPNLRYVDIRVTGFQGDFTQAIASEFGRLLGNELTASNRRIAVIAFGNAGAHSAGDGFLPSLKKALEDNSVAPIADFPADHAVGLSASLYSPSILYCSALTAANIDHQVMVEWNDDGRSFVIVSTRTQ
jgi:hypothetical protein